MFFRGIIMEKHIMGWLLCSRTWLRNLGMFKTASIKQHKWTQSILHWWHHLCRADFQPATHHDCPACPQPADLRTMRSGPLHWEQLGVQMNKPEASTTPAEQKMSHFTKCIVTWGTHFHRTLGDCKSTEYWAWGSAWGRNGAGAISYEKDASPNTHMFSWTQGSPNKALAVPWLILEPSSLHSKLNFMPQFNQNYNSNADLSALPSLWSQFIGDKRHRDWKNWASGHLHGLEAPVWVAARYRRPFLQSLHEKKQRETKQRRRQLRISMRVSTSIQGNIWKKSEIRRTKHCWWVSTCTDFFFS